VKDRKKREWMKGERVRREEKGRRYEESNKQEGRKERPGKRKLERGHSITSYFTI